MVDFNSPLSLYSIPVVWFTSFYPNFWKFLIINRTVGYNKYPRTNLSRAKGAKDRISPELSGRLERMEGAHLNGNEALPLWAAAVLAGNLVGLDNRWMNNMSASYVVLRLLFNHLYINFNHIANGVPRTVVFFVGLSSVPLEDSLEGGWKGGLSLTAIIIAPRMTAANLAKNKDLSPEFVAKAARMEAAHQNGLESLPLFGLAVIAGNVAGLDNTTLNIAAGSYLVTRMIFNYVYFIQQTKRMAALRSLTWIASLTFPFYILVKSAQVLGAKS
ncbi:hypothetical protein NLJ89_g5058 [Agrocybe chaxingu]|uniref:Uncharacterized protein n=1 Tax=Agrocybe chaxingu TaxID=84603 RepID=A0A9W8K1Q7_9AGAR|nr:hypothetical protein NLJ89_g5058 [Agrocybe chaxingu]